MLPLRPRWPGAMAACIVTDIAGYRAAFGRPLAGPLSEWPTIQPKWPGRLAGWSWRGKFSDIPHTGFPRPLEAMKGGGCGIRVAPYRFARRPRGPGETPRR